jgi:arginase
MWYNYLFLGLVVNTINIPFDNGANILGSKNTPKILEPHLNFLNIDKKININTNNFISNVLDDGYNAVFSTMKDGKFPLTIGGDHTVAISSIFAVNEFCNLCNKSLGILWCDAHADFNTMVTSPTKNIHGMPLAVLCGHTLPGLQISDLLSPNQFAYYGVRDIDSLEFMRMQEHNMCVLETERDIDEWLNNYDYIHISFDIDCLDPSVTDCVNTPVNNGKTSDEMKELFKKVKKSNKLCGLDVVEYNSGNDDDHSIIIDIIKTLFE